LGDTHVQAPLWQSGDGCAQVVWLTQVPMVPQVWVTLPLQLSWPGPHTPVQEPL
jgi:hypothetical protein